MTKEIDQLIEQLKAGSLSFKDVISFIESHYQHQPAAFRNGEAYNKATENQGSAKVLTFAKLHQLSKENTLLLFAEHYQSVLQTPDGIDHQNIRQFIQHGWEGVAFEGNALTKK